MIHDFSQIVEPKSPFQRIVIPFFCIDHGKMKDGKEWMAILVPVGTDVAKTIINCPTSSQFRLNASDLKNHATFRIQIREELRKNAKLGKGHRTNEVIRTFYEAKYCILKDFFDVPGGDPYAGNSDPDKKRQASGESLEYPKNNR